MTNFTGNCSNLTNAEALYCLVQNAESFKFQFRKFQALLTIMTVENCWFIQELKKIDFTLYLHKSILYSNIDPPCGFEKTFVKKFSQKMKMYFFQIGHHVWYFKSNGLFWIREEELLLGGDGNSSNNHFPTMFTWQRVFWELSTGSNHVLVAKYLLFSR